jgi:hypothetical protein
MHARWQPFSPNLIVEVERSLLKRWVAVYTLASVEERRKREAHEHARSPHLARRGGAGDGSGRMNGLAKFGLKHRRPTTSFCRLFFAMSSCIIHFDRDRPSQSRDTVTLGRSSL